MTGADRDLCFDRDGAQVAAAALDATGCALVEDALAGLDVDVPGVRIGSVPALRAMLAADGPVGSIAAAMIGPAARPVRAVLFDKTAGANWALGWHQDRTIVVADRIETDGFGPWTCKAGLVQVEPPFAVLAAMATLRIHLDPVDATNAPLWIVPGSHRLGRIAAGDIAAAVDRLGTVPCLADRGDIWAYATPIVHGSRPADPPRRRRVLQIDYAAGDLPPPLRWKGL